MNPELEALLKAWDVYLQAAQGQEAERLLALYDARLEEVCTRTKIKKSFWIGPCSAPINGGSGPTTRNFRVR